MIGQKLSVYDKSEFMQMGPTLAPWKDASAKTTYYKCKNYWAKSFTEIK